MPRQTLHAEDLPGTLNTIADFKLRHHDDSSNWRLHPQNAQLAHYFSWKSDLHAAATDALAQPWGRLHPYAFPPFALFDRYPKKAQKEKVDLLLVALVWSTQSWYPFLLEMLVEISRIFPQWSNIFFNPCEEPMHALVIQNHLTLAPWPISGSLKTSRFSEAHAEVVMYFLEWRYS